MRSSPNSTGRAEGFLRLLGAVLAAQFLIAPAALAADEARLLRYPDEAFGNIVFVSQNDLWTVPVEGGIAIRLTALRGVESHPKFSPDGKWVAFNAQYEGGNSVYVMSAKGGEPRRLTYHPEDSMMVEWSPDGKKILYTSSRLSPLRPVTRFFEVSFDGGPSEPVATDYGTLASYSPDGGKLVFNRHTLRYWWRKRYQGTLADDLWILDRKSGSVDRLTNVSGNNRWPMWGADGKIYFVSERGGLARIYALDPASQNTESVTADECDVQWPSVGSDGRKIVYECGGRLFILDIASRRASEVRVQLNASPARPMVEWVNPFKDHFVEASLSPSGRRVVLEARGDIFSLPAKNGDTLNLTASPGARDRNPVWSPDGARIAYVSDATGEFDVFVIDAMGGEPRKLTETGGFKSGLQWSPDSRRLLFTNHEHDLLMLDVESRKLSKIAGSKIGDLSNYAWSPDSLWIAYVLPHRGGAFNTLWLHSLATGRDWPVTDGNAFEASPAFDPGGTFLYFLSTGRAMTTSRNLLSGQPRAQTTVMFVSLGPETEEPFIADDDREPTNGARKIDGTRAPPKPSQLKISIEPDEMAARIRTMPIPPGEYRRLSASETHLYYLAETPTGKTQLIAWNLRKRESTAVIEGLTFYATAANGDGILYQADGKLAIVRSGEVAKTGEGLVDTGGMMMRLDRRAEWRQVFEETWRMVRDWFYVDTYHGVDWTRIGARYRPLVSHVRTREELTDLLLDMIGELNVSHQGAAGGDTEEVPRTEVAFLGAELEPDIKTGYYRFTRIYRGDNTSPEHRSPLSAKYVSVREGDFLLKINGRPIKIDEDYLRQLVGLKGRISITTSRSGSAADSVDTSLTSIGWQGMAALRYSEWIRRNEALVDELSGSRVGYVRLTDMQATGLKEFTRGLIKHRMKDGVILDVRNNSGGYIETDIIDLLERRPWISIQQDRYVEPMWRPNDAFYGHVAVLVNEYSWSDAELFPIGFKARRLGKLVGVSGPGFHLGSPEYALIDGGTVRRGLNGLWDLDGGHLEGTAAVPDVKVENNPIDVVRGKDAQLEAAVRSLLEDIRTNPPSRSQNIRLKKRGSGQ